jgi:hypothetical protein
MLRRVIPRVAGADRFAMADFFISYTSADRAWAEWIGYVLEEKGFTVTIQAWDFRPGSNFVVEMQKAATEAERTIMVLSPDYLKSQFGSAEWAAAFAEDPEGLARKLLPIMGEALCGAHTRHPTGRRTVPCTLLQQPRRKPRLQALHPQRLSRAGAPPDHHAARLHPVARRLRRRHAHEPNC